MARTVTSPIDLPAPQAYGGAEVLDTNGTGGVNRVGRAINTLYEELRGTGVMDSGPIIDAANTAMYRVYVPSPDVAAGRRWDMHAYVFCDAGCTIRFRDIGLGSTASIAIVGAFSGWCNTNVLVGNTGAYRSLYVDFTAAGNIALLTSFSAFDRRNAAVLPAVGAGLAAYASGFVPLDITALSGERPLSSRFVTTFGDDLISLYEERVGQIIATNAYRGFNSPAQWKSPVPTSRGQVLQARIYAYWTGGAPAVDLISLSSPIDTDVVVSAGLGWYTLTVDVQIPTDPGSLVDLRLAWTGGSVTSISGFWLAITY